MITVKVDSEDDLKDFAAEALHILVNLRHSKNFWNIHFGSQARDRMAYWEDQADKLLAKHGINEQHRLESIKVYIH